MAIVGLRQSCLLICAGIAAGACVHTTTARVDDLFKKTGLSRASFELHCPESELRVTTLSTEKEREYRLLGDDEPFPGRGDTVGVRGCGREAVYVYAAAHGWVNNTGAAAEKATP